MRVPSKNIELVEIQTPPSSWLSQVVIRQLRKDDLHGLEWEGTFTHFRGLYRMAYRRALRGDAVLWVTEGEDQKLLGQVFVLLRSEGNPAMADGRRRAFIHSFRVRPEHRRAGLGSQLMDVAEDDLFQRGFGWVMLNVAMDNHQALHLYARRGYVRIGREPGRWSYRDHMGIKREVHEPSWRMQKRLQGRS